MFFIKKLNNLRERPFENSLANSVEYEVGYLAIFAVNSATIIHSLIYKVAKKKCQTFEIRINLRLMMNKIGFVEFRY